MSLQQLKQEAHDLVDACADAAAVAAAVERLRAATPAPANADPSALVSFDADGTGYTAEQLGETLDARVEAMRRGEGVLTLAEFEASRRTWRQRFV